MTNGNITKIWWIATVIVMIIGFIPCFGWLNFFGIYLAMIGLPLGIAGIVSAGSIERVVNKKVIKEEELTSLKIDSFICIFISLIAMTWCPIRWGLGWFII